MVEDLKAGTSGDFQKTLVAMVTPVYEYLASELKNAMGFWSTDKKALIYIICSASNYDIIEIKRAYALSKLILDHNCKILSDTEGFFFQQSFLMQFHI